MRLLALVALLHLQLSFCQTNPVLELERPTYDTVAAGATNLYEINLAGQSDSLSITVTPLSDGDPDLFCSTEGRTPTKDEADYSARGWGQDTITIPRAKVVDPVKCVVFGFQDTEYTIVASINSHIRLDDGIPQSSGGWKAEKKYFQTTLDPSTSEFSLIVTPISGIVSVYVGPGTDSSQDPDPNDSNTYFASTQYQYTGAPIILRRSQGLPVDNHLRITVVVEDTSIFSVVISGSETSTVLRSGIPVTDTLQNADYFMYNVSGVDCSLIWTLTAINGDPDLFVSRSPKPNSNNAEFKSTRNGGDSLTIAATPGAYYASVVGLANTTFSLVVVAECAARNGGGYTYLVDGAPQHGRLDTRATRLYQIEISADAGTDLTVSVVRQYGDPDLYIKKHNASDLSPPGPGNADWSSVMWGDDLIVVRNAPQYCIKGSPCIFHIAVFSSFNCSFDITASTSEAIITLQEGVPLTDSLYAPNMSFFRLYSPPAYGTGSRRPLTISVTDFSRGDPDLYVSTTAVRPNASDYMWVARQLYNDSITIPPTDPNYCVDCVYHIGVSAFFDSVFTIVAHFGGVVRLSEGSAIQSTVKVGEVAYYSIELNEPGTLIEVSVSNQNGMCDLLLSNSSAVYPQSGVTSTFQFSAYWYNSAKTLTVRPDDVSACKQFPCMYILGVAGVTDSLYSVSFTTSSSLRNMQLQTGVPVRQQLQKDTPAYFQYQVAQPGLNLTIVVTAISGDPDLFVSRSVQHPDASNAEKFSMRFGGDLVDYDMAPEGTYYIAISSSINSEFSVMAQLMSVDSDAQSVVQLVDGQPQVGAVFHTQYRYYTLDLRPLAGSNVSLPDVTFTLTNSVGDPDLFVSSGTEVPTKDTFMWSSTSSTTDMITVPNPVAELYTVAVYGFTSANYTLVVSTGVTSLQGGVPMRGNLMGSTYRYYSIIVTDTSKDLTITVTPFSGDPDLFVSQGELPADWKNGMAPNRSTYGWSAQMYRADTITIPSTDPRYADCQLCTYIISVFAFTPASYTITASFSDMVQLSDGLPQESTVTAGGMNYYSIQVPEGSSDVTFSVTPLSGNPNLYINAGQAGVVAKPTHAESQRHSSEWFAGATITYRSTDDDFCSGSSCVYLVGVYGDSEAHYTLVATTSKQSQTLQNGIPVRDWAETDVYQYYVFTVDQDDLDLTVTVTAFSGDPDLFVSPSVLRPNSTSPDTLASRVYGGDAVTFKNAKKGTYGIGVYAFQNATFSIVALLQSASDNSMVLLVDGVPQSGNLTAGSFKFYHFSLTAASTDLTISVSRVLGDPDLYITNNGSVPSLDLYQWKSSAFGSEVVVIKPAEVGEYIIGVYAFIDSLYDVSASTSQAITLLQDGVAHSEQLEAGTFQNFQLLVDRVDQDLTVVVTSFDGDPDLFISTKTSHPNATDREWEARSYREDAITIVKSRLRVGTYYIAVYAFTNCSFTVLASYSARSQLQDGTPQGGIVSKEAMRIYTFHVSNNALQDVSFVLTPTSGSTFLFAGLSPNIEYSNTSSYLWSSYDALQSQTIVVRRDSDANFVSSGTYYVMVYGLQASQYTLLATTSGAAVALRDGVPQYGWLDTHMWSYYTFHFQQKNAALAFLVTPISGDADLYVTSPVSGAVDGDQDPQRCIKAQMRATASSSALRPNATCYTWKEAYYGPDSLYLDTAAPNFAQGTYVIGVYSFANSTFSVMAQVIDLSAVDSNPTNRDVILSNGSPQAGYIPRSNITRYYDFYMPAVPVGNALPEVSFTVTPRYGDPDVYARLGPNRAGPESYTWLSRSWGRDSITIKPNDPNMCTADTVASGRCLFTVAVTSYSVSTLYTIVAATQDAITLLDPGVPYLDSVPQDQYRYYAIAVSNWNEPLVISVTVLSDGNQFADPDLFVAYETFNRHPNRTSNQWNSSNFGDDVVIIQQPQSGMYYIGVLGWRNTTFALTATNGPVVLVAGEPHRSALAEAMSATYIFYMPWFSSPAPLEFALQLTDLSGTVDMYVSNLANNSRPGAGAYQWKNKRGTSVRIERDDSNRCQECVYYVTVVAPPTRSLLYSITAVAGRQTVTLQSGKVLLDQHVDARDFRPYRVNVDQNDHDLAIDVTEYVGLVRVFVSPFNPDVGPDHFEQDYDFVSTTTSHVTVPREKVLLGLYYVNVYSENSPATFSIIASTNSQQLVDGQARDGIIPASGVAYFYLPLSYKVANARLELSVGSAAEESESRTFTLYMSDDISATQPTAETSKWTYILSRSNTAEQALCLDCIYFIGVKGTAGDAFTIKASTGLAVTSLISGVPVAGTVLASTSLRRVYRLVVPQQLDSHHFQASVETCHGSTQLYASQDQEVPSLGDHDWQGVAPDTLYEIDVNSAAVKAGRSFYLAVYGTDDSRFQISATVGDAACHSCITRAAVQPVIGSLEVASGASGEVAIKFRTVAGLQGLEYSLFVANETALSQGAVMYTPCGLTIGATSAVAPQLLHSFSPLQTEPVLQTSVKLPAGKWFFNVLATNTSSGGQAVYLRKESTVTTVTSAPADDTAATARMALAISIPACIALTLAVCYLIRKNRKMSRQLDIEMSDVPKSALEKAAGFTARTKERGGRNYDQLLATDELDDDTAPSTAIAVEDANFHDLSNTL